MSGNPHASAMTIAFEEKELLKDTILSRSDKSSLRGEANADVEPVVTVMATGTDAEQAEYVSHMVYYFIKTAKVRFLY